MRLTLTNGGSSWQSRGLHTIVCYWPRQSPMSYSVTFHYGVELFFSWITDMHSKRGNCSLDCTVLPSASSSGTSNRGVSLRDSMRRLKQRQESKRRSRMRSTSRMCSICNKMLLLSSVLRSQWWKMIPFSHLIFKLKFSSRTWRVLIFLASNSLRCRTDSLFYLNSSQWQNRVSHFRRLSKIREC